MVRPKFDATWPCMLTPMGLILQEWYAPPQYVEITGPDFVVWIPQGRGVRWLSTPMFRTPKHSQSDGSSVRQPLLVSASAV